MATENDSNTSKSAFSAILQYLWYSRSLLWIASSLTAMILTLLVIAIVFGPQLSGALNAIGLGWLYNEESGVYADCSKAANRYNPYCVAQRKKSEGGWRNLNDKRGGSNPFSLNN